MNNNDNNNADNNPLNNEDEIRAQFEDQLAEMVNAQQQSFNDQMNQIMTNFAGQLGEIQRIFEDNLRQIVETYRNQLIQLAAGVAPPLERQVYLNPLAQDNARNAREEELYHALDMAQAARRERNRRQQSQANNARDFRSEDARTRDMAKKPFPQSQRPNNPNPFRSPHEKTRYRGR